MTVKSHHCCLMICLLWELFSHNYLSLLLHSFHLYLTLCSEESFFFSYLRLKSSVLESAHTCESSWQKMYVHNRLVSCCDGASRAIRPQMTSMF